MPMPKKPRAKCLNCDKEVATSQAVFCSNSCYSDYKYKEYIQAWKEGKVNGTKADIFMSNHLRRYLMEKYEKRCSKCGWNEKHPITGKVPLEIDHIDGNWTNNDEANLQLLCPNCHSLTPTFKNLNKGKGRANRIKKL
jgi:Zn finger protein HypA/HybF involved in hydrogenase expression